MANANKKFYTDVQIKSDIIIDGATTNTVPVIDASKKIKSSTVTSTELEQLSGVTSPIQTQIDTAVERIDDLTTLSGVPANSMDLGTFTGSIIPDNSTIKSALQSLETSIGSLPDPMEYKGLWDASTNSPALTDGTGNNGDVWYVSVAGTQFTPAITFAVGDKAVYNGATGKYEKWDTTESVNSVNGQTGVVVLDTDDISEGATNLYFTDERAQDAVGGALVDSNTVDFTYNDGANTITADVKTQMSITSDASGLKLDGDSAAPGNTKYYGTDASGVKGFFDIPAVGSPGDIQETSFSLANNQAVAANVTGLAFSNAVVRSFKAQVSVAIDASTDLFEHFELNGVQRGADWAMSIESEGDDAGIVFTITNSGQVQYTSSNYTGFSSGVIKFRAWTTSV